MPILDDLCRTSRHYTDFVLALRNMTRHDAPALDAPGYRGTDRRLRDMDNMIRSHLIEIICRGWHQLA